MNQEQVLHKLLELYPRAKEFTVIFSGKKSGRVNGLYKLASREIIIHNRNFYQDDGPCNENKLMYTAIHELAHHICYTELGQHGPRAHTRLFWSTFHDLLGIAESKGIYRLEVDAGTRELIKEARDVSCRIAALQRDLGRVLLALGKSCERQGLRPEDVIDRKVQVSRNTMRKAVTAYNLDLPEDTGADVQAAIIEERDPGRQKEILAAAGEGKTIDQMKRPAAPAPADPRERLVTEKKRLEKTIRSLEGRLAEVMKQLKESARDPPGDEEREAS